MGSNGIANSQQKNPVDVAHLARLARMELTPDDILRFQSQLAHILEHIERLNELDVGEIEPTAHAVSVRNVFREDAAGPVQPLDQTLGNAPSSRDGLFLVPPILE